jgi:hypothetical protein
METSTHAISLEEQIGNWRNYLTRRQVGGKVDLAQLENQLRTQITALLEAGLATEEAFLVAIKRIGKLDSLSREFAREHSTRLWKQLVLLPESSGELPVSVGTDAIVAFAVAVAVAVAIKVPALFGILMAKGNESFYLLNASLFVLPLLTGYFVWKRRCTTTTLGWLAAALLAAAILPNLYPLKPLGYTLALTALHLPIALWLIVGIAYAGGRWCQVAGRMDFIRFSGELFIYYVLIALGGGVFTAFLGLLFNIIGFSPESFIQHWLVPCGAAGAVVIASWLAEARENVIGNIAPMLTRLFTPLFASLLVSFLAFLLFTGRGINIERDMLIAFDLLLVVVLGLLLYSISARDPGSPRTAFDIALVVLVISGLLVDAVALWAILARISEFGLSPNRVAALGVNLILLVNLAWSAVLYLRFLAGRGSFASLEKWQTDYLPVYAVWAALVVILFPPLFRYI